MYLHVVDLVFGPGLSWCVGRVFAQDLPVHPGLRVVANSEQHLQSIFRRRLITMEKTLPYDAAHVVTQPVWCCWLYFLSILLCLCFATFFVQPICALSRHTSRHTTIFMKNITKSVSKPLIVSREIGICKYVWFSHNVILVIYNQHNSSSIFSSKVLVKRMLSFIRRSSVSKPEASSAAPAAAAAAADGRPPKKAKHKGLVQPTGVATASVAAQLQDVGGELQKAATADQMI
jgi:hypothetical protein